MPVTFSILPEVIVVSDQRGGTPPRVWIVYFNHVRKVEN